MQGIQCIADTYIDEHNLANNNGEEPVVYLGRNATVGTRLDGLFRFPQPSVPENTEVFLVLVPAYQNGPAQVKVELLGRDYPWDEEEATWQTVGEAHPEQVDPVYLSFSEIPSGAVSVNITAIVAANAGNSELNIRISAAADGFISTAVHSRNSSVSTSRPKLVVISQS